MTEGDLMENYLLEMKDIAKIYGNGIVANEAVNFNLKKGKTARENPL